MTLLFDDEVSCLADADDVVNCCRMAIICPRGRFYPDKNYGSSIIKGSNLGEYLAAARQAVSEIDGVFIKNAEFDGETVNYEIMVNNDERSMKIAFEKNI